MNYVLCKAIIATIIMNNERRKVGVGKNNLISNKLNKYCLELDISLIRLKHWVALIRDILTLHNALFSNNTAAIE